VLQCLATVRQTWRLGGSLTRFMMETPIPVVPVQVQYFTFTEHPDTIDNTIRTLHSTQLVITLTARALVILACKLDARTGLPILVPRIKYMELPTSQSMGTVCLDVCELPS